MKKILFALLFASAAYAAGGLVYYTGYAVNTLAGAPDAGNTWAPVNGATYFRTMVTTDAGSAFTAGTMRCYFRSDYQPSAIQRCPGADFALTPLDGGTVSSQAFQVGVGAGQVTYMPESVTMNSADAGGNIGVVIEVQK